MSTLICRCHRSHSPEQNFMRLGYINILGRVSEYVVARYLVDNTPLLLGIGVIVDPTLISGHTVSLLVSFKLVIFPARCTAHFMFTCIKDM